MNWANLKLSGALTSTFLLLLGAAGFAAHGASTKADTKVDKVTPQQAEFFETHVRPLLVQKCYSCHNDNQQMGNLRLDSLEAILKGGNRGAALIPGNEAKSLLLQAVHYDTELKMPPAGKLKADEIAILTNWVKMGAPWPGAKVSEADRLAALKGEFVISESKRRFWSFVPVKKPALPKVTLAAWIKSPIDRFVLAKLEAKALKPAPPADKTTLIRRVTFDLTGLPPTPDETAAFLSDKSSNAYPKVVDRLLASPRYGERWGRHWLDVARYADTKGYTFNEDSTYHNAYTYRDYVIRAFNEDKPYDQFLKEQLAADLLPMGEDRRSLAALGYLTLGRRFLNDPQLINDDRIDVTCRGMMGLTVACARCHNHKFDPISAKDYYALYGVFQSSTEPNPPPSISPKAITEPFETQNSKVRELLKVRDDTLRTVVTRLRETLKKTPDGLPASVKTALQSFREEELPTGKTFETLVGHCDAPTQTRIKSMEAAITGLQKTMPPSPEFAMAMQDLPKPVEPHVFIRGNAGNVGDAVPRRFLQILSRSNPKPFTQGSGRLEMAQDIASKDNPLTARVFVNRVWLRHFGKGLVRTPSDFGLRGDPPTHPELLDYLASRFVEDGWSVKKLQRLIVLSSTYQQSCLTTAREALIDPENRLISHMNRQRFDLEELRDSLLAVSGQLDTKAGGPSVELTTAPYSNRRTVYGFIERQNLPGLFRTFDFASPDTSSAQRFQTMVPQQALYMMNSPFVIEQAQHLVSRPDIAALKTDTERIQALYRLLFARGAAKDELAAGLDFLAQSQSSPQVTLTAAEVKQNGAPTLSAWERYAQILLMTNEFSFID